MGNSNSPTNRIESIENAKNLEMFKTSSHLPMNNESGKTVAEKESSSFPTPQSAGEAFFLAMFNGLTFGCTGALYYPLYRRFLEKKFITFTPGYKPEDIKNYVKAISEKGGHFGGFKAYLVSKLFPLFFMNLTSFNPYLYFITTPLAAIASYPFYVNSNLKALKLPGYASLTNFAELKQLVLQKSSYKGFLYYLISEVSLFVPYLNYLSHRFETIRLAYVFGPYFGHNFNSYKQAKEFVKVNKGFTHGRFIYNLFPNVFNIFATLQILNALAKIDSE